MLNNLLYDYLDMVFYDGSNQTNMIKYFNRQLFRDFSPDINGYTLMLMVPPDLSGYRIKYTDGLYDPTSNISAIGQMSKVLTFAAVDFSPPQSQVNSDQISSRTGAIPYATEVNESETCSVTYIENNNLDIYLLHHLWVEYIREVLAGSIDPDEKYINGDSLTNDLYGCIDYAASLYILKYKPDMRTLTFAGKCMGIFPQSLPNKELIGSRSSNEITTLPFTYFCTAYREVVSSESNWILDEVNMQISRFGSPISSSMSDLFSSVNSYVSSFNSYVAGLNNAAKSTRSYVSQATGTVNNLVSSVKSTFNSIKSTVKFY